MTLWEYAASVDGWLRANGGGSSAERISDDDYEKLAALTDRFNGVC